MYFNTCSCWFCVSDVPWLRQQTPEDNILAGTTLPAFCPPWKMHEGQKISRVVLWARELLYSCRTIWEIGIVSLFFVHVFAKASFSASGGEGFLSWQRKSCNSKAVCSSEPENSGPLTFCPAHLSPLLLFLPHCSQSLSLLSRLVKGYSFLYSLFRRLLLLKVVCKLFPVLASALSLHC